MNASRASVIAEALFPVLFVVGVVALEPTDLAIPFNGEDVMREAGQEPPVVADEKASAGETAAARFVPG